MTHRWVLHVFGTAATLAVLALLPSAASAHPEACAEANLATMTFASPFEDWGEAYEGCMSKVAVQNFDDSDAQLAPGETAGTRNLKLLASTPKSKPFEVTGDFNSDLAFEDGYAYQGNYDGVQVWNVDRPRDPELVGALHCPGSQNDVTVNDGIMVTSTDSRRNKPECDGNVASPDASNPATNWEGIRIFDVSDPKAPEYVTAVRTACGSHTHTVVPERNRLLIYVSSYDIGAGRYDCEGPHDQISIVEIPKRNPKDAKVIREPVLFPDGGETNPNTTPPRNTTGCHDITVYQELDIAAGACVSQGIIMDISDADDPKVISSVTNPTFAFWHSATISNDGKKVLFTDELGGGSQATCNRTIGPERGADAIYDIRNRKSPRFLSYFKIPRTQANTENCVAHNGNIIPDKKRDLFVQSWYQGGMSIIDWTNPYRIKELAWFDRGPFEPTNLAGFWSTYYYDGHIYGSEIQRGFDVFKFNGAGSRSNGDTVNAQTQYELYGRGGSRDDRGHGRGRDKDD